MTSPFGWLLSSVDDDYPFWEVNSLRVVLPLLGLKAVQPKKGWSPPKEVSHHPQMAVTDLKKLRKTSNYMLTPPRCLLIYFPKKYLGIEIGSFS